MTSPLLNGYAIIGMARSGIAAAKMLQRLGYPVFISDIRQAEDIPEAAQIKESFKCEFGGHTKAILEYKTVVVSPGVPINIPILLQARQAGVRLISEIELGYQFKHPKTKIIAVTGSNGKSTTVSLIHYILTLAGIKSVLAGNIGTAFTAADISSPDIEVFVLELSSFQLELLRTFRADAAAILNITPDHLSRYDSFRDYAQAKMNIFRNQTPDDLAVINADDGAIARLKPKTTSLCFSSYRKTDARVDGNILRVCENSFDIQNIKLKGSHNLDNIMASLLLLRNWKIPYPVIKEALETFTTLPHRLEPVGECCGISFINDSKATNTGSVCSALHSFHTPVRIILGGSDKGEDFRILSKSLFKHAAKGYLIGETTEKMREQLSRSIPLTAYKSLEEATQTAFKDAAPREIILLSPACASFDMFRNFEDRGNQFKAIVKKICSGESQ
ncbi:MAG: UDP-N-acetylmuramoyl-L-alanine--D-glutamate ligase [Candidatus Cloacimonetes bacterium]|nr:UDP-N-acetylmuramoyl-L-alanine--D-glutamate ligase [Candidatus Cloacimonadota bacterium]